MGNGAGRATVQKRVLEAGEGGEAGGWGEVGGWGPGLDSTAPYVSPADIVRPRVLRPPVPHALGARTDPHAAAASARLLLVRGGDRGAAELGEEAWGPGDCGAAPA